MESLQQNEATEKIPIPSPNIYQRISAACQSISTIVKTGQIETKGRTYTVATQSDVLLPVRDAINQNGLSFISKIKSWNLETKRILNQYGKEQDQFHLTLIMEYCLVNKDNPVERIPVEWPIVCSDDSGEIHKLFGKALTYALKYYFIQTFMLPRDDDDPDLGKNKDQDKKQGKNPPPYPQEPKPQQAPSQQIHPPTNGNGTIKKQPQSTPQPPATNGEENPKSTPQPPATNGNHAQETMPVAAQLRDDCVAFLKTLALGADLEKEFFSSFEAGASMLSQIPDTKISSVHSFLKYAFETHDPIMTIKDHITKQKLFAEIRNSKDVLLKSAKLTQEQLESLIAEYTKGRPHTALTNDDLKSIVDALNKKIAELNIENGKKKQQ